VANRHYAKIADVWKHLPLAELLSVEHPARYLESHAGSALYPFTPSPERDYGVRWFLDHAAVSSALAGSAYYRTLERMPAHGGYPVQYPGSAMLAMLLLERTADYVLCDIDPESVSSLRDAAARTGLVDQTRIVEGDGREALWSEASATADVQRWAVHIDPFDAFGAGPSGAPSAVALARRLAEKGAMISYWYGYDDGNREMWAWEEIGVRAQSKARSLWCGDVRLAEPETDSGIVGCGVLIANATEESMRRCGQLGQELERIYRNALLPSGRNGSIRFRFVQHLP
jgi:23S rRNA A2030 N6-methylase RlmJ